MRLAAISLVIINLLGYAMAAMASEPNMFVLAGKDASLSEGDQMKRAVFFIRVPEILRGKIHIRIFDADLSGHHDRWDPGAEVTYRVFGKGQINRNVRSLEDPVDGTPLETLTLAQSRFYDNQWRTIASLSTTQGEPDGGFRIFQLIVDGSQGRAINKYSLFVSSMEKENRPIDGIHITSPVVMLYLPPDSLRVTQLRFDIPADSEFLNIFNFDADKVRFDVSMTFETRFHQAINVAPSKNGKVQTTQVAITPEQKGQAGGLVIRNRKQANYIQVWIQDDKNRPVLLVLPAFFAPENHLPVPVIQTLPLSKCFSLVLDASQSTDPDNDQLSYTWNLPDGVEKHGPRIVHDFGHPGDFPVTLTLTDDSGFVANSSRIRRTVRINAPPTAGIHGPAKGVPNERLEFDGSPSSDVDGKIITYRWEFGDGETATGKTVSHAWTNPGRYPVTLTVEDNGKSFCSRGQTSHMVWINAPPIAQIVAPDIAAVDEVIVLDATGSVDSDGEIVRYEWDFGDQSTDLGDTVSHSWKLPGTYTITLKISDEAGLANSWVVETHGLVINAPPVALPTYPEVVAAGVPVPLDGSRSKDPDGTLVRYLWQTGDGTTLEGKQVRHVYSEPGVYTATLTVTDNTHTKNNTDSREFTIRVNNPPEPDAGPDQVVNTSVVTFDAGNSKDVDDPIIAYQWDFGDGTKGTGKQTAHVYAISGTYTVTLTVTDGSGTSSATRSDTAVITVNNRPVADAGPDRLISPGDDIQLDAGFSSDPDGQIVRYQWHIPQDRVLEGRQVTHRFDQPGKYPVRLTITDNHGAMDVDTALITVNAPPKACIAPFHRTAPGTPIRLDGSCSTDPDGKLTRIHWDFGDGTTDTRSLTVDHVYKSPGRYPVTLTVTDDSETTSGTTTASAIVEVNFPPVANAGEDRHLCSQTVEFDASASIDPDGDWLSYHWDFGDGTSGTGVRIVHTYAGTGTYPVTLQVDDGTGLDNAVSMDQMVVRINAPPKPVISTNSARVCAGELVLFDGGKSKDPEKGILRYVWDLGDGNPVESVNPVRVFEKGGDYRIRLTVTDDSLLACGVSHAEMILHVIDAPIAEAGPDQTVCANTPVQFDGTRSVGGGRQIRTYEWDFGDGQFGVGPTPTHVYAQPGTYTARLVISVIGDSDCENAADDEVSITVLKAPRAVFESKAAGCPGEKLLFDAGLSESSDSHIVAYQWDFGDGTTDEGESVIHQFAKPGMYPVTLTITCDTETECKTATSTSTIKINASPKPMIELTTQEGKPFSGETFEAIPMQILYFNGAKTQDPDDYIQDYTWDFGDGHTTQGPYVTYQYKNVGEYTVSLRTGDGTGTECSEETATLTVVVTEPHPGTISGPLSVCVGEPVTYALSETVTEPVQWQFSDGVTGTGATITRTFQSSGVCQLQAKLGDQWKNSITIRVYDRPKIMVPDGMATWKDDTVIIEPVYDRNGHKDLLFQWDTGEGNPVSGNRFRYQFAEPGNYTVQLTVTGTDAPPCFTTQLDIPVTVYPWPKVEILTEPKSPFAGGARDDIRFEVNVITGSDQWLYHWQFGDGQQGFGRQVFHRYGKPGSYTVKLTLSDPFQRTSTTWTFSKVVDVAQRQP